MSSRVPSQYDPTDRLKGIVCPTRKPDGVLLQASQWFVEALFAKDSTLVLPQLTTWLRADPSHRAAFVAIQTSWQLAGPFFRAAQPGAGSEEIDAFFAALSEEVARSPKTFADV